MSKDESPDILSALRMLCLMLPITVRDVKEAYLPKAKLVHPDARGNLGAFKRLQVAYERALAYAQRYSIRWIGQTVERYLSQQRLIEQIEGYAHAEPCDLLAREFGDDFAHLYGRLVGIRVRGPHVSHSALIHLIKSQDVLASVRWIDLAASRATCAGLESYVACRGSNGWDSTVSRSRGGAVCGWCGGSQAQR